MRRPRRRGARGPCPGDAHTVEGLIHIALRLAASVQILLARQIVLGCEKLRFLLCDLRHEATNRREQRDPRPAHDGSPRRRVDASHHGRVWGGHAHRRPLVWGGRSRVGRSGARDRINVTDRRSVRASDRIPVTSREDEENGTT